MKQLVNILRYFLNTLFFILVLGTIGVYSLLHFNIAGKISNETITPLLCEKLKTQVEIGEVEVNWLNQVALNNVVVYDQQGDTLLYVRRVMMAYEIQPLLKKQLVLNTVQLIEFDVQIRQESINKEPNFQFLVDALAPKKENKRTFINDLSLHALNLRQGRLSYRLGNSAKISKNIPDYRNLQFKDITASLNVEVSHINGLDVLVKRMSLKEDSGLSLEATGIMHDNELHLECKRLVFDSPLPAYVEMKGSTDLHLSELHKATYQAEISNAEIATSSLLQIADFYELNVPGSAKSWMRKVYEITFNGHCVGTGNEKATLQGNFITTGEIKSSSEIKLSYLSGATDPMLFETDSHIATFPYNNHVYRNIHIVANSNGQDVHADINSADPECKLSATGDFKQEGGKKLISFDTEITRLSPYALNLSTWENLEGISLRGAAKANIEYAKGSWPLGDALLESITLTSETDTLYLEPFNLTSQKEENTWVGVINSPILNFVGTQTAAIAYIPTNEQLANLLKLPGYLSKDATFVAEWDSIGKQIKIEGNIPELATSDGTINAILSASGQSKDNSPFPVQLHTNIAFDYITPNHMLSSALVADIKPEPLFIELETGEISVDGHPFTTEGATLSSDNGVYTLAGLYFHNGDQSLGVNGYMRDANDMKAQIQATDLKIDFFLDMLGKRYLDFGGYATGNIALNSDSILHLSTEDLFIRDFSYMDRILGDNWLTAYYDLNRKDLYVDVDISNNGNHSYANGEVFIGPPGVKTHVDLNFDVNQLPIDFCDYWLGGFLQDFHGYGKGKARIFGDSDKLNIVGHPVADVNFTHDLLGARFYFNDTIHMATGDSLADGRIWLNHAILRDYDGQLAIADVNVTHRYLSNFVYDADINIESSTNGFMVYDYPNQRNGELYWGQLYANGRAQLHGSTTTSHHRIGAQMEPAGKSVLYLSPGEANFSENAYNFLSFRDKTSLSYNGDEWAMLSRVRTNNKEENSTTYIEADLQIHANEHCLVNMQMDPLAEDRLLCRGEGDIALHYDSNHDINITGVYDISQGSYTITMRGDLMSKSFQLQKGSRVSFSGVPSEAELALKANYSIPAANLKDLDESFTTMASMSRTTLPVDCKLFVDGSLTAPQISFDLEVKNVSDDIQTLVHNIIGTPEMLNREVFYLLLFNKFYTPEYASTSQNNTSTGLSSFASATLTSQLNNLLGHMSDNFSLGTNFHSEKGDFSDMEMDLTMQTRLFSDRLLLSGNLSYRDPANRVGLANSSTSFIGDFDIEYLINPSGTLRAKAYSHYNERYYSINNALTTQGIGIIMRKDFKSLKELLPWHPKATK